MGSLSDRAGIMGRPIAGPTPIEDVRRPQNPFEWTRRARESFATRASAGRSEPNMNRPIRRLALALSIALAVGGASCSSPPPAPPPVSRAPAPAPAPGPSDVAGRVVEAHNAERARRRLAPLALNAELESAAMGHAGDMAGRRKMSHRGGDGSSPFDRIKRTGYSFRAAGENVAYGFDEVESVMAGWMRSPGHRRNILGDYAEMGVGRATGKDGAAYWCVTFGTASR